MLSVFSGIFLDTPVPTVQDTAQAISELGILNVASAALIVIAFVVVYFVLSSFKKQSENVQKNYDQLTADLKEMVDELLDETRKQNHKLTQISEGLIPETELRIKNMSGAHFDLAMEKVAQMVDRVRKENHISDREKTLAKIRTLITNLHLDRNSRFDKFFFNGKKVSDYTNPEWIDWVADIVEQEVYATKPNHERTRTNVKAVYEKIKIDFYNRIKANIHL